MGGLARFGIGVAGAFVVYIFMYRESRIAAFAKKPKKEWQLLVVDLFVYLIAGGLIATFLSETLSPRSVFLSGATWQGVVGGFFSGQDNDRLRREVTEKNEKLRRAVELIGRRTPSGAPSDEGDDEFQTPPEN